MDKKVLVTGVKKYDFVNKETGEVLRGCNVYYVDSEGDSVSKDIKGIEPCKASLPIEAFDTFKAEQLPGIYDLDMKVVLQGKKPSIRVVGFKFAKAVNIQ